MRITDTDMTSDSTRHTAHAWPVPDEPTLWSVTSALRAQAPSFTAGIARTLTRTEVTRKHARISA